MEIAISKSDSVKATITPRGRVDADSGPQLKLVLQDLAAEGVLLIVVDLQEVDFMDSSGLSALVSGLRALRERGIEFLRVPQAYYNSLPDRIGAIKESYDDIADLGILADRDDEGYLLQIFTRPIQDRPTVFLEVIQRRGARGFGVGNFKALFESIEIEQEKRGNL